jgi:hypothetical protein
MWTRSVFVPVLAAGLAVSASAALAQTEITPAASGVTASTNDGNLPANVVDNNLATRWSANGDGQWLQLDLGTVRSVGSVAVAVYNGNSRQNRFDLQLSSGGGVWTTVWSGQSSGNTTLEEVYDFADADARYVRYLGHSATTSTFNSVTEVSVFAGTTVPTDTPTPVPTATPTAAPTSTPTPTPVPSQTEITPGGSRVSASTNDGNLPANTVDGSLATRWSANGDGQWIQYDLGATHTIAYVRLAVYNGNTRQNRFDLQVGGSSTGPWTNVITSGLTSGTTTALETHEFADASARYVRYLGHTSTTSTFNSLSEVEIWGSACTSCPTPTPTATPTPVAATPTPQPTATPNPSGFRHPGVLVNRGQLDFVKAKIQANAQPWKAAFDKAVADSHGSLSYTAHPRSVVECGPSSNPNLGCSEERSDAQAAYTHALLWYFTGNSAHANKAIQIMNAWSGTITDHTNHNAPLQTGWAGSMWAPAGEIIAHTGAAWSTSDRDRFKSMLRNVYRPELINGSCANGNWELIMTNALMGISVFLDDRPGFDKAVLLWRGRVPAYVYQTTDGSSPRAPGHCSRPSWYGQTTFVDGVGQETCRDFGHMEWGLMAGVDAAETAYQQGLDLYAEQSKRWRDGLEFHAKYDLGAPVPSWLCGGSVSTANTTAWEIAYNHYVNRKGHSMPNTAQMVQRVRPTGINYFIAWETLTHAGTGNAGF